MNVREKIHLSRHFDPNCRGTKQSSGEGGEGCLKFYVLRSTFRVQCSTFYVQSSTIEHRTLLDDGKFNEI